MVALASELPQAATAKTSTEDRRTTSRLGLGIVFAGLLFGGACLWYLAVDTLSAGVFSGQTGIPFASTFRRDPDRMLQFAVSAQRLNDNRGLPVFVEASLRSRKIAAGGGEDGLAELTLATYQRAVQIDPWNGSARLGMAQFVDSQPSLRERLGDDVTPESLVLASLEIDPLFVPGLDWLIARYERTNRARQAYDLVCLRVLPWLRLLGTENADAAVRYFRYLEAGANQYGDEEVIAALDRLRSV